MKVFIESIKDYDLDSIEFFLRKIFNESNLRDKLKSKKKILIKPNLLGPFNPERAVTSHPVLVEALIRILIDENKEIYLGDSPGGVHKTDTVYEKTGMKSLALKYPVHLLVFGKSGVIELKSGERTYFLDKNFFEIDGIINVSKYKTHSLTKFTGAIKNTFGLIPGLKKTDYHKYEPDPILFSQLIVDLFVQVEPKIIFNIMDGIWGMEGFGPSGGNPRNFGVLFASESALALDYCASRMMGFEPLSIETIRYSLEKSNLSIDKIEIDSKWQEVVFKKVKLPSIDYSNRFIKLIPKVIKRVFKVFFDYYPYFNDSCKKCMICKESCPVNAIKFNLNDKKPELKREKCIKCLCCHEFCSYGSVEIKKTFLAKLFIK